MHLHNEISEETNEHYSKNIGKPNWLDTSLRRVEKKSTVSDGTEEQDKKNAVLR